MSRKTFDPEKFKHEYDAAVESADNLARDAAEEAKQACYIRDDLRMAKPYWFGPANQSQEGSVGWELLGSGGQVIGTQAAELSKLGEQRQDSVSYLGASLGTVAAFVANTSTASNVVEVIGVDSLSYRPDPSLIIEDNGSRLCRLGVRSGTRYGLFDWMEARLSSASQRCP